MVKDKFSCHMDQYWGYSFSEYKQTAYRICSYEATIIITTTRLLAENVMIFFTWVAIVFDKFANKNVSLFTFMAVSIVRTAWYLSPGLMERLELLAITLDSLT